MLSQFKTACRHRRVNRSKRLVSPDSRIKSEGLIFRDFSDRAERMLNTKYVNPDKFMKNASKVDWDYKPEILQQYDLNVVPRLFHGLDHAVTEKGLHLLKQQEGYCFDPKIEMIIQPRNINMDRFSDYNIASDDMVFVVFVLMLAFEGFSKR